MRSGKSNATHFVALKNTLITHGKFNLSAMEFKVVMYLISKIKPMDEPNTEYVFNIGDFIRECDLNYDGGFYYSYVRKILEDARSKTLTVHLDDRILITGWFNEAEIMKDTGEIKITFPEKITPYLFNLRKQGGYTQFRMETGGLLKTNYAQKLYLGLRQSLYKSNTKVYDIEQLRFLMECSACPNFKDFRREILAPAVEEINTNTELRVSFDVILTGRKATHIQFKTTNLEIEIAATWEDL